MSFKNKSGKENWHHCTHSLTQKIISKKIFPSNSVMKKSNRGLTLVELMVVGGMLGGLSLVVMNISKQSQKVSAKSQFDTDVILTTNEINAILSDPVKCLATLGTTATPTSINGKYFISTHGSAPVNGYGNSGLKIINYSLAATGADGVLTIFYQNKNILKGTGGVSNVPKTVNIYLVGTPGAVTNCRSLSTSTTDIWARGIGPNVYYNGGNVGIGTTSPNTILDVNGAFSIREMAEPALSPSDQGRIFFDSTANKFKVSENGGAYVALVGGTPAGANTQVQFNNAGAFGANANFVWDNTNGRLGIGTTAPRSQLSVGGDGTTSIAIYGFGAAGAGVYGHSPAGIGVVGASNTGQGVFGSSTTGHGAYFSSNSNTGVTGLSASGDGVNGFTTSGRGVVGRSISGTGIQGEGATYDFYAQGPGIDYGTASSIRWKTNIKVLTGALDNVLKLKGISYDMNEEHGGGRQVGFIGEEVGKYYPEIVSFDSESEDPSYFITGLDYSKMTPVLLEAIKELYHKWFKDSSSIHREIAELKIKARNAEALNKVQIEAKFEVEKVKSEVESAKKDKEIAKLKKENEEIKAQLHKIEKMILKRKP